MWVSAFCLHDLHIAAFSHANICVHRRKNQSKKCEISVSAYGEVKLEPEGGEYEDPDKIRSGQGNYKLMHRSADDEFFGNKQAAAVHITAEDTSS